MTEWRKMVEKHQNRPHCINIGLVGKYTQLHDVASLGLRKRSVTLVMSITPTLKIHWIDSETLNEESADDVLGQALTALLIPVVSATGALKE